jgi:hypothetical protein
MGYLDAIFASLRKFDEFWEYEVETQISSIEEV